MISPRPVTVIVPNRDGGEALCRTLDAILTEARADWDVIVVDDGSTDGSPEAIHRRFPGVRLLMPPGAGRGAAFARNVGLSAARGEDLLCVDTDVVCAPGCLTDLLAALAQTDIAFPRILTFDGQLLNPVSGFARRYCMNSAVFAMRREALARMDGPFDETIEIYGEDNDFFLRAAGLGLRFAYVDQALAYHPHRELLGERHYYLTVRNAVYVWRKLRGLVPYWMPMNLWIGLFLLAQLGAALANAPLGAAAPARITRGSRLNLLRGFTRALCWNWRHGDLARRGRERFRRCVAGTTNPCSAPPASTA